jgi:hypothetical protein
MVKNHLFTTLLLIGIIFCSTLTIVGQDIADTAVSSSPEKILIFYEELFDQLMNLKKGSGKVASVNDFSFQRDVARFHLQEGELYLLPPVMNRTAAALFLGKGTFFFTPPTDIEKDQLSRFYDTRSLEKEFTLLFLVFADSSLEQFKKQVSFEDREIDRETSDHIENCLDYISNKKGNYFDASILRTFFQGEQNGLFYAHLCKDEMKPLFFKIDPYKVEEVRLLQRAETQSFYKVSEVVCQFHQKEDYVSGKNLANESKDVIRACHYTIESTIEKNLNFSAIAEVELMLLRGDQNWLYFEIFKDMEMDSAFWGSGEEAVFFKKKNNPFLWVRSNSSATGSNVRTLKLYYHGDLVHRNEAGWIYIKSSIGWYPRYGYRKRATFDLTFHTHKDFTFASVGDKVSSQNQGDMVVTRWVTPEPIRNASFNLGYYKSYELKDERIPPLTVHMAEGGHREIGQLLGYYGILSGKNMEKQVGGDIANSLSFFQHIFGESPVKQFYATEVPYSHGLAFPGLIHLSWTTFQRTDEEGYDEIFRAHEVAHQWWGIEVDFKTYHDQWLSEGFSEYAGLWYMQTILQDNKKFFTVLDKYRDEIFDNRKFLFFSGQEAGPIWLGYRTRTSNTEGDYNLIIYKKGAWVLHMLRSMLLDLRTMNEDRFKNILQDFYQSYRDKKASTEDFQRIVEKHVGGSMEWFFKQWVYGTDLPTYRFSYKTKKREDKKFLVRYKVKQEDVPDDFQAYITLLVDFGKDRFARLRIYVTKSEDIIALPLMPLKPKKIIFNDLESALCKVKYENWEE